MKGSKVALLREFHTQKGRCTRANCHFPPALLAVAGKGGEMLFPLTIQYSNIIFNILHAMESDVK